MIVNVNPYDTGYDENSHVMKFAALAREVCTTVPTAVSRIVPAAIARSRSQDSDTGHHRRKVTISLGGPGQQHNEAELEVLEGEFRVELTVAIIANAHAFRGRRAGRRR